MNRRQESLLWGFCVLKIFNIKHLVPTDYQLNIDLILSYQDTNGRHPRPGSYSTEVETNTASECDFSTLHSAFYSRHEEVSGHVSLDETGFQHAPVPWQS